MRKKGWERWRRKESPEVDQEGQEKADESEIQQRNNRSLNCENNWTLPIIKVAGS